MSETDTTNPVDAEELVSTEETGVDQEAHAQDDENETDDETGEPSTSEEDELEEIERQGKKYRIPKALKSELLMQADYTRKTQELAETKRETEAKLAREAASIQELREDIGRVTMLETQLKAYDNVDWQALRQQDPDGWRFHSDQLRDLKDQLKDTKDSLSQKETARSQEEQAQRSQALRETAGVLARDIKGFNQETASKIIDYGVKEAGMTPAEARELADPRIWKLLHRAMSAESELKGLKSKATTRQRVETVQAVQPAVPLRGTGAPDKAPRDNDSMDSWLRKRQAQLAKR